MTLPRMALACAALLLTACPEPPADGGSSSSGSGGASSSSSTGGGAERVELGALCRELRDGFRGALLRTVNRCGGAYIDEDLERLDVLAWPSPESDTLLLAQGQLPAAVCDQFGSLRVYVDHVLQSVDRDRVTYSAENAFKCRASSTRPALARRDRPPVETGQFSLAGVNLPEACHEVFRGTVEADAPCELTHECAAGLFCRPVADDTSAGTCRPVVAVGERCDSRDECDALGVCEAGRCRRARAYGESCLDAQGYQLPCGPELVCRGGLCVTYGTDGALCGSGYAPCAEGLVCARTGPSAITHCRVPGAPGAACSHDTECGDCQYCNGEGACAAFLSVSDACLKGTDRCGPGLYCADDDTCQVRPREGEPCAVVAGLPVSDTGNCLYADTFCARAGADEVRGTCRAFPVLGQPCGDAPGTWPTCRAVTSSSYCSDPARGECVPPARLGEACSPWGQGDAPPCEHGYCRRESADAGSGDCRVLPDIGEPCGTLPHLSAGCQTGFCQRIANSATGTCVPNPDIGEPCGYASHLSSSCTYGGCLVPPGASDGTCRYLKVAGEACQQSTECDTGVCDPFLLRCITPGGSCQGCARFEPILFILSLGLVLRRRRRA
ncbi:MAG: hypothetical protein HY904_20040 [Deltaproteobacteria bacterium]|nr:hypothetical protein [Deltaproteobacteria bacterium]